MQKKKKNKTEKSETKYEIARVLKLRVIIDIENSKARACDPPPPFQI